MAENLKELVDKKKSEFTGLHGRMDADKDIYLLTPYTLKDFSGKPLPKVVSTTLNDPATFAHRAIAILSSADPQVVVESDTMNATQEHNVEQFIGALEYENDARLANMVSGLSFPFFCEQSCVRGWLAGMSLLRMGKNGNLIVDRRPVDSRCVMWESGIDGLVWGSYETKRSKAKIMQEYGHDIGDNVSEKVLDIYSREKHETWIGEKNVRTLANPYKDANGQGYVPFVIQPIPTGSMLTDDDLYQHQGESIFALDRALYPKMNEMASVLENLTMATFFAAKQYASDKGEAADPEDPTNVLGGLFSIEKGGGYTLIPIADIRNATRLLYSIYENRIQRGSLPNIDYGNLTFPLSAVAISRLTESKDMIFVPRLQGLAMFYQQWDRMAIRQYNQIGKNLKLGEEGGRKVFPVASLKGEYTIKRKYYSMSPDQDIANTAIAQQHLALGISRETIFRHTLKLKDPDGELMKSRGEKAEQLNPVIMLRRQAISLVNNDQYFEAELVLQSAEDLVRQRAMGQAVTRVPERPEKEERPQNLIPLLEGGGGGPRGKSEEEKVEEEINEEERVGRLAETARVGRRQEA